MTDHQDVVTRCRELAKAMQDIQPTRLPLEASPDDIMAILDDLKTISKWVDPVVLAIAEYFEARTGHKINRRAVPVEHVLRTALDGMLIYEIESAAETLADELQQDAYYSRHNHEIAAE